MTVLAFTCKDKIITSNQQYQNRMIKIHNLSIRKSNHMYQYFQPYFRPQIPINSVKATQET